MCIQCLGRDANFVAIEYTTYAHYEIKKQHKPEYKEVEVRQEEDGLSMDILDVLAGGMVMLSSKTSPRFANIA
jgi:hypothetical protein